jgi:hypothetical protein
MSETAWQLTTPVRPTEEDNSQTAGESQTYAAHVELAETAPTAEQLDQLIDQLGAHNAEAAVNAYDYLTVQLEVPAADFVQAAEQALALVVDAAQRAGITDLRVVQLEILHDVDELQRRAALPPPALMPRLLSKTEAAGELDVSPQLMNRYANEGRWGAIRIGESWAFPAALIEQEKRRRRGGPT